MPFSYPNAVLYTCIPIRHTTYDIRHTGANNYPLIANLQFGDKNNKGVWMIKVGVYTTIITTTIITLLLLLTLLTLLTLYSVLDVDQGLRRGAHYWLVPATHAEPHRAAEDGRLPGKVGVLCHCHRIRYDIKNVFLSIVPYVWTQY
jgi:hypothetical protein